MSMGATGEDEEGADPDADLDRLSLIDGSGQE